MAWTQEQQQAIDEEGKNIIVSAGAGSGKTAVLTARVLRKLQSGIHVNELLVLTFTNAAAAEMKERIRKAIIKTPGLEEEANLIDSAYITTFDSFSLSMVKKYHTKLNMTNKIQITDEVMIELEKKKILDQIMDENYLSPKESFSKLINDFCLKDDKELKNSILSIYKKIELKYDKEKYLKDYIENAYSEEKLDQWIQQYMDLIDSYRKNIQNLLIELNDYFDGDYISKVEDALKGLMTAKSYEEVAANINLKLPPAPRGSAEEGKKIKAIIADTIKELKKIVIDTTTSKIKEEILSTKSNASAIIQIIIELDKRLTKYKRKEEIYNFTDIARLAIQVVSENPEIKEELQNSFNEILVDEYQDTSDTQEKFISLISKNNVYMVGDIKQSIYRFRNANPYIFKNKYDTYRDTDQGIKIDLVKNFRSRQEVLNNINLLFELFMDDEIGGADYKTSHRMIFGNTAYIEEGKTEQNYDLDVIVYKEPSKNMTKDEQEAFMIGENIKKKIEEKFQVFDKDEKVLRDIEYSDFVILLDKSKNFDLYKKIFEYLHIPLTILKDEALRKDQDILVLKSLLKLLICIKENNLKEEFIYSFISVSRSYLFKTPDEEIYNYYVNQNYKESPLYQKCLELTKQMDYESASNYLYRVLESFDYDQKLITIGNVKSFRIRSEYFYNLCKNFEEKGNTIYDFVNYLDDIFDNDYDLKFSMNTMESNSCKIMTIHKSKGLEFPICYFAGFSSRFNISELKEKIIYDNKYGIVLPKVDNYYKDTILKILLKQKTKQEEISERIRLLYVAVTRAKEKMIIVMPEQEEEKEIFGTVPSYERNKYNSFLSVMKSIYSVLIPYIKKDTTTATKDYLESTSTTSEEKLLLKEDTLEVTELKIKTQEIEESHYSKESLHITTKEEKQQMDLGIKIHQILEQLDFEDKQALEEMNIPNHLKNKIKDFLEWDIIKKNIDKKMYKEYEFLEINENNSSHGIIDLLIEGKERMIIIDYKSKNIDDAAYEKQLDGYKKAIQKKTNKTVDCYLYSILEGKYRKVENEEDLLCLPR